MTEPIHPEHLRDIKYRHTTMGYWSTDQRDDDVATLIAEVERLQEGARTRGIDARQIRWWMENRTKKGKT